MTSPLIDDRDFRALGSCPQHSAADPSRTQGAGARRDQTRRVNGSGVGLLARKRACEDKLHAVRLDALLCAKPLPKMGIPGRSLKLILSILFWAPTQRPAALARDAVHASSRLAESSSISIA